MCLWADGYRGKSLGDTVQSFYRKTHPKPQSKQVGQNQPRDRTRLKHPDCSHCALCFPRTENLGLQLTGTRSTQDTTNPSRHLPQQCWGGHKGHPAMLLGSGIIWVQDVNIPFWGVVFGKLAWGMTSRTRIKGNAIEQAERVGETPWWSFCHCTCWFPQVCWEANTEHRPLFHGAFLFLSECQAACPGDWGSMHFSGQGSEVHWNLLRNL